MTLQFAQNGSSALIYGVWHRVNFGPDQDQVNVIFDDREQFDAWVQPHEVERRWRVGASRGVVQVQMDVVDEVVSVRHFGNYRGTEVIAMSNARDGQVTVALAPGARRAAKKLGFDGNQRDGFDKRIPVSEFTDVTEEITVKYRRGEGWLRG